MSSVRARKSLTSQAVVCLQVGEAEEEPPEALDMSWPSGARKRITYILLAPIVFPLWLTLPDTRSPRGKYNCLTHAKILKHRRLQKILKILSMLGGFSIKSINDSETKERIYSENPLNIFQLLQNFFIP